MSVKKVVPSVALILIVLSLLVTACGPTPEPVKEVVTQVVKETVIVEGTPEVVEKEVTKIVEVEKAVVETVVVEKIVVETVVVEKEVLVEAGCGGEVIMATNGDSEALSPLYGTDSLFRSDMISEPLVWLDAETLVPIPWLAESWEVSEDGTTYIFKLRDGPKWPDGEPLTAQDFEFTVVTILSPDVNSDWKGTFSGLAGADQVIAGQAKQLEGLKVIDDKTFQIKLDTPNAAFLTTVARHLKPIPKHLLEEEELTREHPFAKSPVGVGPYRLAEYVRGDHLILEAKDDYWGKPVCQKRLVDRYITDMNALVMALEAGEVDFINPVSPRDALRLMDNPDIKIYQPPASKLDALFFNTEHEILAEPKVRQAISMVVDRQKFIDSVLGGVNRPVLGLVAPTSWAYDETAQAPEYDLAKAKALLAEAGYPDGFTIKMVTNAGNTVREQFLTYVQSQLALIGVTADPEFKEWSTFITGIVDGDFEIAFLESRAGVPDPDTLYATYHTEGGMNYGNYSNPEVDELLEQARINPDLEQREELYSEVQQILVEELPRVAVWEYLSIQAAQANITNLIPSALGTHWDAAWWRKQ